MTDVRTLAAAVLGIGLGLALIAYPDAAIRAQTAGRVPGDRGGEYGASTPAPARWRWIVRALGAAAVLLGLYFGASAVGF